MATKHQTESYRIKGGVRFECWTDIFDRDEAKAIVQQLRGDGRSAFFQKIDDGVWRIFAIPTTA